MLLDAADSEIVKAASFSLLSNCVSRGHIDVLKVLVAHPSIDMNAQVCVARLVFNVCVSTLE